MLYTTEDIAVTSIRLKLASAVIKKIASIAGGILLMLTSFSDSAYALNGYIHVANCGSCATSADYIGVAKLNAETAVEPGTYIVVNTGTKAATAYVVVTGTIGWQTIEGVRQPALLNIATNFIDMSGNSLAGSSEASLQVEFATMDLSYFGVARDGTVGWVSVPADVEGSFINCDLELVGTSIANWISTQYHTTQVPLFAVITLQFHDGTYAQFVKISLTGSLQYQWNLLAWKQGPGGIPIPINHDGSTRLNPNSGGNGKGSFSTQSAQNIFNASAGNQCVSTTSVTWGGVFQGSTNFVVSC